MGKGKFRRGFLAICSLFLLGAVPIRRTHFQCDGMNGCAASDEGPRSLTVFGPSGAGHELSGSATNFPDIASSWDVNFATRPQKGPMQQRGSFKDVQDSVVKWAGDRTSSIAMFRDNNRADRKFFNYSFNGLAPGSKFTEMDWFSATSKTGVSFTESPSASIGVTQFSAEDGWPWLNGGKDSFSEVTPFFRIYDHGMCSFELPWRGQTANGIMGIEGRIPEISRYLPRLGTVVYEGSVVGHAEINRILVQLSPRFSSSGPVSDTFEGVYPVVNNQTDSMMLAVKAGVLVIADIGPYEGASCSFNFTITADAKIVVSPESEFGKRVVFESINLVTSLDELSAFSCTAVGYLVFKPLEDTIKDAVDKQLKQRLHEGLKLGTFMAAQFLSVPVPTQAEALRWIRSSCPPQLPGQECVLRQVGENFLSGTDEATQWINAIQNGSPPPIHTLSADNLSAPFVNGATPGDEAYNGCLRQDLTVDVEACRAYPGQYGLLALAGAAAQPELGGDLVRFIDSLNTSDFECRSFGSVSLVGLEDPLEPWKCVNGIGQLDDRELPLCEKEVQWDSEDLRAFGAPPSRVVCKKKEDPRPKKSSDECLALSWACRDALPTETRCLDYYFFCTELSTYCDDSFFSFTELACKDAILEPRCLERMVYCDSETACQAFSPVLNYCNSSPPPPDDVPPIESPPGSENIFRTPFDVYKSLCSTDPRKYCSCSTNIGEEIPEHRCAIRLPIHRVNITPGGIEAVMANSDHERWYRALRSLSPIAAGLTGNQLDICDTAEGNLDQQSRPRIDRAGSLPVFELINEP